MRIRRTIAIGTAALFAIAAAGLTGCADGSTDTKADPGDDKVVIGMANFTLGGPYFVGMRNAVQKTGEELGWTVNVADANGDATKLQSDVENFITQGVDGIIISGGPLNDFPQGLAAAKDAGIPVVLVDRQFSTPDYAAWIGPDNEGLGKQNGEFIKQQLPEGGVAVIIKGGPADNTIGIARTTGVTDALTAAGNFTINEAPDFGNWATDGGKAAMENMLARLPKIDVVFCENDAMCLGAQTAAADANRSEEMFFAGIDGQNEAIQQILAGTNYKVTGYNDSTVIGRMGVETLKKILDGESVTKDSSVDSPMITIDNAEEFKDAGIYE